MQPLFHVIYEDGELLAVHKPADLVCHPTKGDEFSSLISRARLYLNGHGSAVSEARDTRPSATAAAKVVPYLIHRLDRETSGVVLMAKNAVAARELGRVWETRTVCKEYVAIVHGHVTADHGLIDAPLGRDEASPVAIKDCVRPDGAAAQTEFWVEERFVRCVADRPGLTPFSLLRLRPLTGRKHQLRIHLAHIGHAIVGDKLYGGNPDFYLALVERRLTAAQLTALLLPHHALHAGRLSFEWRDRVYDLCSPPEASFAAFVAGGETAH
jgi:23S rRNA pseudouridine1911/1915/1917 synthase